jgi:predicted dinucleotide-binding enzyme
MNVAVFGTGMVGETIANALLGLGHAVTLCSRAADNPRANAWKAGAAGAAAAGTFADGAAAADIVFLCLKGEHVEEVVAGLASALSGKILIDLTNPLDFSKGMPPTLFVSGDDSLGERIQRAAPQARVVKTLNTVNANLMVAAGSLAQGQHTMLISGDDNDAKASVIRDFLTPFGWTDVIDLGGIAMARGQEAWMPVWLRLWGALKTPAFNMLVVRNKT